jgi:hypothetical protein
MLTAAWMSPEETEGQGQLEELRTALRHVLPPGVSASIRLLSGRTVYVTVGDISRTGACVVRRGSLEVMANEEVLLDISDYEQHQNISLPARVQWVNTRSYNTLVGLLFSQGPLLPGTMIDQYLDKTLMARGSVEG